MSSSATHAAFLSAHPASQSSALAIGMTRHSIMTDTPLVVTPSQAQEEPVEQMTDAQIKLGHMMEHDAYEVSLGLMVAFNVGLLVVDLDVTVRCGGGSDCTPAWVSACDYILLTIYSLDLVGAIFCQRLRFFRRAMNWLDLVIVTLGLFEVCAELITSESASVGLVRLLRIARIVRVVKLLKPFPELHRLVSGIYFTIRAIFWGAVLILILLVVWSIIILSTYTALGITDAFKDPPFSGYWCEQAMEGTFSVALLLWQTIIVGDSWGACSIPVILKRPEMYCLYAGAFVCINIGFINLILAVIVESATLQHEEEIINKMEKHLQEQAKEIQKFRSILQDLDRDDSNTLSLAEMLEGYDDMSEFRNGLLKFGIDKSDIQHIFSYLDLDDSGGITYMELVNAMFRAKRQEPETQMMMIHIAVDKLLAGQNEMKRMMNGQRESERAINDDDENKMPEVPRVSRNTEAKANDVALRSSLPRAEAGHPALEEDLERLRHIQLENLELRLESATRVLHQQSLGLAEETQKLKAALEHMQEYNQTDSHRMSSKAGTNASTQPGEAAQEQQQQQRRCASDSGGLPVAEEEYRDAIASGEVDDIVTRSSRLGELQL